MIATTYTLEEELEHSLALKTRVTSEKHRVPTFEDTHPTDVLVEKKEGEELKLTNDKSLSR